MAKANVSENLSLGGVVAVIVETEKEDIAGVMLERVKKEVHRASLLPNSGVLVAVLEEAELLRLFIILFLKI